MISACDNPLYCLSPSGYVGRRLAAHETTWLQHVLERNPNWLGYTLPQQITRKAHIEKLRIYVSGENLFFWSPLKKYAKNYDPEMITAGDADFASKTGTDGQGYGYPMTRSVTIGLNINF